MTLQEARESVVQAGIKLVEAGLIARTWGNVSCRISESHFVITPTGRDYLSLSAAEIVEVAISDCSYTGDVKPSSEKGVHAEVYKLHPEINFVIHTHQVQASVVGALLLDKICVPEEFSTLSGEVICASYGLPGSKKLRRGVAEALVHSRGKAVILKNHGALCFGIDCDEAFKAAFELEQACERFILDKYSNLGSKSTEDAFRIGLDALSKITGKTVNANNIAISSTTVLPVYEGRRADYDLVPQITNIPLGEIHKEIYTKHEEINNIIHVSSPDILIVSYACESLLPFLDDFAQIAGVSVKVAWFDKHSISSALKSSSAVLVKNKGAICCGCSEDDARAVAMVLEKNCKALVSAALFGRAKPINLFESILMRHVYLKKYSKLKNK